MFYPRVSLRGGTTKQPRSHACGLCTGEEIAALPAVARNDNKRGNKKAGIADRFHSITRSVNYSARILLTGFASAALIAWKLMVNSVITIAAMPDAIYSPAPMLTCYW